MKRKVQRTGGSTLIVSLPKDWVKKVGLDSGDEVSIHYRPDNSLVIIPSRVKRKNTKNLNKAELEFTPKDGLDTIFRIAVSYYLSGYDIINITFKEDKLSQSKSTINHKCYIKNNIRDMIGIEIIDEGDSYITLQNFINYEDLPLRDALKRMMRITNSMMSDAKKMITMRDINLAEDIKQRDKEVNRFYYLIIRLLNETLTDVELAKKLELNPRDCILYSNIAKSLERIGDHCKKISKESLKLTFFDEDLHSKILNRYSEVQEVFKNSISCLLKKDAKSANETIVRSNNNIILLKKLNSEIIVMDNYNEDTVHLSFILESLKRICYYSNDICENTINLNIKIPDYD